MIRRPPRSTPLYSSAASDVYKRQSLLRLRKENKLPPHMSRVSPPRYWKDGETGGRKLTLVVREDNYVVDGKNHIILKYFNMKISFTGRLRWHGKQGRLEIYYDEVGNAWYASIPVEVGVEETKTGRRSKHVVRGERKSIQVKSPKGSKMASIDLGINVLASVVIDDGTWLLYKGVRTKEDYFYFGKRIAEAQSSACLLYTSPSPRDRQKSRMPSSA